MEYEIRVNLTKQIFDRRFKEFRRPYLMGYAFYVGLPTITFLLCLATGEFVKNSAGTLILGLLLGCSLTQVAMFTYEFRGWTRQYAVDVAPWYDQELIYEFKEETIVLASKYGREILPWGSVMALRAGPTEWFLVCGYSRRTWGMPIDLLSEDVKRFIKRKVVEAGGEVFNR